MSLKVRKSNLISSIALILFWLLIGFGFLGSNSDICNYKSTPNFFWAISEFIGGYTATLTIRNYYLGQVVTSGILLFSIFIFFKSVLINLFEIKYIKNLNYYSLFSTIAISSIWPTYNFFTNTIRQSVAISIFILIFSILLNDLQKRRDYIVVFILFLILIFTHKTSLIIIPYTLIAFVLRYLSKKFNLKSSKEYLFSFLLSSPLIYILVNLTNLSQSSFGQETGLDLSLVIALFIIITFSLELFYFKFILPDKFLILNNLSLLFGLTILFVSNNQIVTERLFIYFVFFSLPFYLLNIFKLIKNSQKKDFIIIFSIVLLIVSISFGPYISNFKFINKFGRSCNQLELYNSIYKI